MRYSEKRYSVMACGDNQYEIVDVNTNEFAVISVPNCINDIHVVASIVEELDLRPRYIGQTINEKYKERV